MTENLVPPSLAPYLKPFWRPIFSTDPVSPTDSSLCGIPFLNEGDEWSTCSSCGEERILLLQLNCATLPSLMQKAVGFDHGYIQWWLCESCLDGCYLGDEPHLAVAQWVEPKTSPQVLEQREFPDCMGGQPPLKITGWDGPQKDFPTAISDLQMYFGLEDSNQLEELEQKLQELDDVHAAFGHKLGGFGRWAGDEMKPPKCRICKKRMSVLVFQIDSPEGLVKLCFNDGDTVYLFQCPEHHTHFVSRELH